MVITACQPFTSVLVSSNLKDFRVEWIWQKNAGSNIGTVKWYPMKEHESVLVFAVGGPPSPYNAIRQTRAKPVKTGFRKNGSAFKNGGVTSGTIRGKDGGFTVTDGEMRVPSSVQSFSRERGLHPTQKPVALCEYFTRTYSNEPDLVFDPYAGSASTAIACAKLKRRYLGVEKDSTYFEAAVKRLSSHYSEK
jgi:site-specific DNA-methyltransferase (adenine-specific)